MATYEVLFRDADLLYGGAAVRDEGDYASVLEVTDLDSAAGATGRVLVEVRSVGLYSRSIREEVDRLREALESCGGGVPLHLRIASRDARRMHAWSALASYGAGDVDRSVIIQTEEHEHHEFCPSDCRDGWPPEVTVDGEAGLIAYLWQEFDCDFSNPD